MSVAGGFRSRDPARCNSTRTLLAKSSRQGADWHIHFAWKNPGKIGLEGERGMTEMCVILAGQSIRRLKTEEIRSKLLPTQHL
jgi:hypothetical protein